MVRKRIFWAVIPLYVVVAAVGAAWDAPRTPARMVEFFVEGERFLLDPFADGYQAVRLDALTEEALRRTPRSSDLATHTYRVIRRGDDFVHFRTMSEETDVIMPIASIRRLSYRVERQFD